MRQERKAHSSLSPKAIVYAWQFWLSCSCRQPMFRGPASTSLALAQGVSDGLKVRIMNAAELGLQKALPAAVAADERLSLTAKVTVAHDVVTQRVKGRHPFCGVPSFLLDVAH